MKYVRRHNSSESSGDLNISLNRKFPHWNMFKDANSSEGQGTNYSPQQNEFS